MSLAARTLRLTSAGGGSDVEQPKGGRSRFQVKLRQFFLQERQSMKNLKVRAYEQSSTTPKTTVTIPGGVFRLASKLIPKRAQEAMSAEDVDLSELAQITLWRRVSR